MPRTGRGGSRQGTPGTAYANRSDLQARKVPQAVAPSPQYGTAVAQQRALQAMPIAAPPGPRPPTPSGPSGPSPQPVVPLDAPSMRPDEHVMAGAPVGPGPGPEALGQFSPAASPLTSAVGLLASLGDNVPDQVKQLRSVLTAANANLTTP